MIFRFSVYTFEFAKSYNDLQKKYGWRVKPNLQFGSDYRHISRRW